MKRLFFVGLVCGVAAVPCLGAPSLDYWPNGAPDSLGWRMDSIRVQTSPEGIHLEAAAWGVAAPTGVTRGDPVYLICIPAPGALLLAGLGAAAVGWLRMRRIL